MPVVIENGREITLERVEGKWVKLLIPSEILVAIEALPPKVRLGLMVKATTQYRLSPEQFAFVVDNVPSAQWTALADGTGRYGDIWNHIVIAAEQKPETWVDVLNYALHIRWHPDAFTFVKDHIHRPELNDATRKRFWEHIKTVCLHSIRSKYKLSPEEVVLLQEYLETQADEESRRGVNATFEVRTEIATALNNRPALKTLWLEAFKREAGWDTSDFGEDDDRDLRLKKLFDQAVAQMPECRDEFAHFAVDSLAGRNRKFIAANLANTLGLAAKAKALYLEARALRLQRENPFSGWDKSRVGDCSFGAGEYETAYGYYLMAEDKYGMFKAAWQFDRARAIAIAREIAVEAIADPYYALNGALAVAQQAELPEVRQVYEKGIARLEENGALEYALRYARDFGDTERAARYELLLKL